MKRKAKEKQTSKAAPNAATLSDSTVKVEKVLSKDTTILGDTVSMDLFIVFTLERLFSSSGRHSPNQNYKDSGIFVNHASGFVFVSPVGNFTAGEALQAKWKFEASFRTSSPGWNKI